MVAVGIFELPVVWCEVGEFDVAAWSCEDERGAREEADKYA